mmetsp:Transcript_985/g.2291  ORF Transcript_985/g.2291 Transcript_985/m.2291 type:complete len:377 (-) Transcript_985:51-1181(-)
MDIESECPHQQNDSQEDRETSDSDGADDRRTSRIVRKNYISMIALAYAMTGVSVWSSSYACRAQIGVSTTTSNAADAMDSRQADDLSSCAAYRGDLILALAKLTLATALLVVSFLNLQGSDPGFVSKELMERLDRVEGRESQHDAEQQRFLDSSTDGNGELGPDSNNERGRISQLYPHTRRKRCEVCGISPPLRSHHCRVNRRCVATFDHHCGFLNTCIGERNHFRFWLFVWLNLFCSHGAMGILTSRYRIKGGVWLAISVASRLYVGFIWLSAALLGAVHTVIAVSNVTTFEMTKGSDIDYLRGTQMFDCPFGRGLCRNIITFVARDDISKLIRRARRQHGEDWTPVVWKMPYYIERNSSDCWNHPFQNKYWSCC